MSKAVQGCNAILVSEMSDGHTNHTRIYSVLYVRLANDVVLGKLLLGQTFLELGEGAVLERGSIPPPDGTPLEPFSVGHRAISSYQEAQQIAQAALANPQSVLSGKGFDASTPIYFWMPGQPAEPLEKM
jgi:hypothetical protein